MLSAVIKHRMVKQLNSVIRVNVRSIKYKQNASANEDFSLCLCPLEVKSCLRFPQILKVGMIILRSYQLNMFAFIPIGQGHRAAHACHHKDRNLQQWDQGNHYSRSHQR